MKQGQWEYFKHPKKGTWHIQCHKNGKVIVVGKNAFSNAATAINNIEACSGSRESTKVEFKQRFREKREPRKLPTKKSEATTEASE